MIFSGDFGCTNTPILPDPDPPESCDLLILESTYDDRLHPGRKNRTEALQKLLDRALADKGIVYISAFSLGRTQELLCTIWTESAQGSHAACLEAPTSGAGGGLGGGESATCDLVRNSPTPQSRPDKSG